jgi:hypothetical protein
MAKKKPLSQQEQLLQNFYNSQESTGSQSEDLLRDVKFMNDKNSFKGSYGVYAGMQQLSEDLNKDRFKEEEGETKTEITPNNSLSDSETTLTPEKRNSNFKQTADMGSAFDSSSDSFDESEFSFLDGMQRKGDFKLNTRGDENEKSRSLSLLNDTNQNENALDVSYKNKAEQDVIKSTGKAVEERNFMSSKTRGGLFGNYGKQVKINKIVDPNTGKVNREKYVDGKLTKSTAEKDRFKREKKSGRETGRANKKANRNK